MQTITINGTELQVTKDEARDIEMIKQSMTVIGMKCAQRRADILMRSAPNDKAQERRKAAVKALGLSDEIQFL